MQYFQFDHGGNMFVYPPGSLFSGVPKLVRPGDDLFVKEELPSSEKFTKSSFSLRVHSHIALMIVFPKTRTIHP